jgi:hypothetical protein
MDIANIVSSEGEGAFRKFAYEITFKAILLRKLLNASVFTIEKYS